MIFFPTTINRYRWWISEVRILSLVVISPPVFHVQRNRRYVRSTVVVLRSTYRSSILLLRCSVFAEAFHNLFFMAALSSCAAVFVQKVDLPFVIVIRNTRTRVVFQYYFLCFLLLLLSHPHHQRKENYRTTVKNSKFVIYTKRRRQG